MVQESSPFRRDDPDRGPRASAPALMVDDLWAPDLSRRALPHGLDDDTEELLRDWRAACDARI